MAMLRSIIQALAAAVLVVDLIDASPMWPAPFTSAGQKNHRPRAFINTKSTAFVPSYPRSVIASLFNRNLWKKKRKIQDFNTCINRSLDRSHFSGMRISMGESSTIEQPEKSIVLESDTTSRSLAVGSLQVQGGASVTEDSGGGIEDAAAESNNSSTDEKDMDENETKLLIHIFPAAARSQHGNNTTAISKLEKSINATLLYKQAMLVGVGMPKNQFAMGVHYYLNTTPTNDTTHSDNLSNLKEHLPSITNRIQSYSIDFENDWESHRSTLLQLWKEERLFCENTGIFSPKKPLPKKSISNGAAGLSDAQRKEEERIKRENNFRDSLAAYAERMVTIVQDEQSDSYHTGTHEDVQQGVPRWSSSRGLLGWVEQEYGVENTKALMASSLLLKTEKEQLKELKSFLEWFKERFPYYHDQCLTCGASCKASPLMDDSLESGGNVTEETANSIVEQDVNDIDEEEDVSFIGYLFPSKNERLGNASRTELYRCRSCDSFTRFPRYNKALWVTSTRRGRCGEYSMLLYRFLRSLGYEKLRWVVDWADHVWVDVRLGENTTRWVHCDPCEASIDEPLLYEGWGKNQTFIIAFFVPFNNSEDLHDIDSLRFPLIEDVTHNYTTDEISVIRDRRGISNEFITETIRQVSRNLTKMLNRTVL